MMIAPGKLLGKRRIAALVAFFTLGLWAAESSAQKVPRPERRGRAYQVSINSMPTGATIYLDDKKYGPVGTTPWEGGLEKGEWLVILEKDGYETATSRMRVRRTRRLQETILPLKKKPNPPKLDVTAVADKHVAGAIVHIDGLVQGAAPMLVTVKPGRHLVEIKKKGFNGFSQWVEVKEGDRVTIEPKLIGVARVRTGSMLIESDIPSASVYIDGEKHKDVTPTVVAGLPEGEYAVEVRKRGLVPWRQKVRVIGGDTVKLIVKLQAASVQPVGTIRVVTNAPLADVKLDGELRGTAPIDITRVPPGEHVIEVSAPNFLTREKKIMVGAGSGTMLTIDLQPTANASSGTLNVLATENDADVFLDGVRLGTAPLQKKLVPGRHKLTVSKYGFRKFERRITIEGNKKLTIKAKLYGIGSLRVLSAPLGATVWLDGALIGTTPLQLDEVLAGEHVLKVTKDGYRDYEKKITVDRGRRAIISTTLKELYRY